MADTRQVVSWSLERECPFRCGETWFLPDETFEQLFELRNVAQAEADGTIIDGICVTAYTSEQDQAGQFFKFPADGYRIEERLAKHGGLSKATRVCQGCEANVENEFDVKAAGCFGRLDLRPDSPALDEQLWKAIEKGSLEDQLRAGFHVTTPLWYGFWMKSPLNRFQAEFLRGLLEACGWQDTNVVHFRNALMAAIQWELSLHVSLAPLGHTDFGYYTVFPHCPLCMANAPVGRWEEEFTSEPYECTACGHTFNPNECHSREPDEFDWDADSLEETLGKQRFDEFAKQYLLHQGCTVEKAKEIIDIKNNGPPRRQ